MQDGLHSYLEQADEQPEEPRKVKADPDAEKLRQLQQTEAYQRTLREAEKRVNRKARRRNRVHDAAKFGHGSMAVPKTRKAAVKRGGGR